MAQKKEKKESAEEKDVALTTQNQEVAKEPVDDLPGENAEKMDEKVNKVGDDVETIVYPFTPAVLKAAIVYLAGRLLERPDFEDFKGFFPGLF